MRFIGLILLAAMGCGSALAQSDLASMVAAHQPSDLGSAKSNHTIPPSNCYQQYDSSTVIAAYAFGGDGALVVLKKGLDGTYSEVARARQSAVGVRCELSFQDIDGDGVAEVIVKFYGAGLNSADYIYKWSGSALSAIALENTPTDHLQNTEFLDLLHDGTLQILERASNPPRGDGSEDESSRLLRYSNAAWTDMGPLIIAQPLTRGSGKPATESSSFYLAADAQQPYTLYLVNGTSDGKNRISSATITLNGQQVIAQSAFNQNIEKISTKVSLNAGENLISFQVDGEPGSKAFLYILGHDASAEQSSTCGILQNLTNLASRRTSPRTFLLQYQTQVF